MARKSIVVLLDALNEAAVYLLYEAEAHGGSPRAARALLGSDGWLSYTYQSSDADGSWRTATKSQRASSTDLASNVSLIRQSPSRASPVLRLDRLWRVCIRSASS